MNTDLIKNIIIEQQKRNGSIWIDLSVVIDICNNELSLELTKEFFIGNRDFRIYRTGNPLLIYITLPEIQDRESGIKAMNTFNLKNYSYKPTYKIKSFHSTGIKYSPIICEIKKQVSEIHSCEDLEKALLDILNDLGIVAPSNFIEIQTLAKHFYEIYRQPIKSVLNTLIPGLSLIEFLQCYGKFIIQESDGKIMVAAF